MELLTDRSDFSGNLSAFFERFAQGRVSLRVVSIVPGTIKFVVLTVCLVLGHTGRLFIGDGSCVFRDRDLGRGRIHHEKHEPHEIGRTLK